MFSFKWLLTTAALTLAFVSTTAQAQKSLSEHLFHPLDREAEQAIADEMDRQLFSPEKFENAQEELRELVGFWTQNSDHLERVHQSHLETGGLRSGSGLTDASRERMRLFEEAEMLDDIEESGETVTDPVIAGKLYERWQKRMKATKGAVPSDLLDLEESEYTSDYLQPAQKIDETSGRALLQTFRTTQDNKISVLEEPYPSNCHNNGQMNHITQIYYTCRPKDKGEQLRVTFETFTKLQQDAEYRCIQRNVTKNVCVCPKGFGDFQCATQLYKKCFLNITEPPFYEGCEHPDTPYYFYSMPGYDPCFGLNFSRSVEIKVNINCRTLDQKGLTEQSMEKIGYDYRDIIQKPQPNQFTYVATNPQTQFSIQDSQLAILQLEIRDFKYVSHALQHELVITDPEELVGLKDVAIELNLPQLLRSDEAGESRYVNGGRAYFEMNLFGYQTTSFTTKGFFDQLGYEEPMRPSIEERQRWLAQITAFVLLGCTIGLFFIYCKSFPTKAAQQNIGGSGKVKQE